MWWEHWRWLMTTVIKALSVYLYTIHLETFCGHTHQSNNMTKHVTFHGFPPVISYHLLVFMPLCSSCKFIWGDMFCRLFSDQLELPFSQWSRQMVLSWLDDLGLGQYSFQCGRLITCGQDLLKASPTQLEKDMGLKNLLHRKKLQLALQVNQWWFIPLE